MGGNGSIGTKVSDSQIGNKSIGVHPAVVGRRGFRHLDTTTIPFFFSNFPDKATKSNLLKLFVRFGKVEEVFIPNKLDKWGRRFGFVKFKEVSNEEELGVRLEEVWMWKQRLKVNRSRFGREERKDEVQKGVEAVSSSKKVGGGKPAFVNGVTFKGVLDGDGEIGSRRREDPPCLEILPSEEMLKFLNGGFMAELNQDLDAKAVQHGMMMEGLVGVKVTGMGDMLLFLKMEEGGALEAAKKEHEEWWKVMFKGVRNWAPPMVVVNRSV